MGLTFNISSLGSKWSHTFSEAINSPFDDESEEVKKYSMQEDCGLDTPLTADNEYYQLMFNLYLVTCY